ncbi:heterokaryon incompatibility protein-domain-containing protein, partial [Halenospora varia]
MLCQYCSNLDLYSENSNHQPSLSALKKSAESCSLCKIILDKLIRARLSSMWNTQKVDESKGPIIVSTARIHGYFKFGEYRNVKWLTFYLYHPDGQSPTVEAWTTIPNTVFNIFADCGTPASLSISNRLVSTTPNDDTFRFVEGCLVSCLREHEQCRSSWVRSSVSRATNANIMPTRLIDVGDSKTSCLRLTEDCKSTDDYIALSHCWGNSQICKLTTLNIGARLFRIDIEEFPRSFRNAVEITRRLKIRYLWIDSLCIIQDDAEDWAHESSMMGHVYHNAFLVIVAAAAENSGIGCLFDRSTIEPSDLISVPYIDPFGIRNGTFTVCVGVPQLTHEAAEDNSPLETRAWAFQERAFARRKIIFTKSQVVFECMVTRIEERGEYWTEAQLWGNPGAIKELLFPA